MHVDGEQTWCYLYADELNSSENGHLKLEDPNPKSPSSLMHTTSHSVQYLHLDEWLMSCYLSEK